eukprot:4738090-Karenia_brevis.AAC.1
MNGRTGAVATTIRDGAQQQLNSMKKQLTWEKSLNVQISTLEDVVQRKDAQIKKAQEQIAKSQQQLEQLQMEK